MLSSRELQSAYVKLYIQLRRYIWDFSIVEKIANLEISVYRTFPDVKEVYDNLEELRSYIHEVASEDEELESALSNFSELMDSEDNSLYAKLNQVREVIQSYEDI